MLKALAQVDKGGLALIERLTARPELNGRLVKTNGVQCMRLSDKDLRESVVLSNAYPSDPNDVGKSFPPFWVSRNRLTAIDSANALAGIYRGRIAKDSDFEVASMRFKGTNMPNLLLRTFKVRENRTSFSKLL